MQKNTETTRDRQLDEELADVLIAISVIAKRLARKLQTTNQEGGTPAFEEVRHRMTVIAQAGYSAEVKALITKYGARKLSDIDPSRFEGLLKEADALGKPEAGTNG